MKHTLRFGAFFGIPVRVHFTFPLILLAFGVEGWFRGGWVEALWAVGLVTAVFACVVLHELGHSLQVRRYGIEVRDIVLLPIGGMARAERIPENPRQEIIVAISGPLVNFGLAAIFGLLLWVRREPADLGHDLAFNLLAINIVLGTFNLIPAFPMDGGRILRGLFALRMDYVKATRYAKNIGQIIAIMFVVVGFVYTKFIMLPLIAVFVFFGGINEEKIVRVKWNLSGKRAGDFVRGDASTIDSEEIHGLPLVGADTPAAQLYYFLRRHKLEAAAITHADGHLLGLVTVDDLAARIG